MKMLKPLLASAALVAGATVVALDAPHNGTFDTSVTDCQTCHKLHNPTGGTFTKYPSNNDSCLTCHDGVARVKNNLFKPAWSDAGAQAVPGSQGSHHNWSALPTGAGARVPTTAAMAAHLTTDGKLQCTTCHDVHGVKDQWEMPIQDTFAQNSAFSSYEVGVTYSPIGGGGALFQIVTLHNFDFFPLAMTYRLRVSAPGTLQISHDYRTAATPTWVPVTYTWGGSSSNDFWLDDVSVLVRFTGTAPAVNDEWEFYVSYPHLRVSNMSDAMCIDCHADRHQSFECVEGSASAFDGNNDPCTPNGTDRYYSHPVNQALNANGRNYDAGAPLDADGTAQDEATEANPSNRLTLDPANGNVTCTTCHAPHNADSNSLSVDVR